MKLLFIITATVVLGISFFYISETPAELESQFRLYIAEFKKSYSSEDEYHIRLKLFERSLRIIEDHNSRNLSYTLGVNRFADLTKEEYKKFLGYRPRGEKHYQEAQLDSNIKDAIDWRKSKKVNGVRDQLEWGSCWAFSAAAAFEGAYAIKYNELHSFSEQQLVDWTRDFGNQGWDGGLMDDAFRYLQQTAFCFESEYKYKGVDQDCQQCKGHAKVVSYTDVPKSSNALKAAIKLGPVAVSVEALNDVFMYYRKGVINTLECGNVVDHAITAVGFDYINQEDKTGYFIVRNSWGPYWGINGDVLIAAGSDEDGGIWGILLENSYPEVVAV